MQIQQVSRTLSSHIYSGEGSINLWTGKSYKWSRRKRVKPTDTAHGANSSHHAGNAMTSAYCVIDKQFSTSPDQLPSSFSSSLFLFFSFLTFCSHRRNLSTFLKEFSLLSKRGQNKKRTMGWKGRENLDNVPLRMK
ncbi:hypothetical protein CEXT_79531 [Caerostris extrusa]|uniref:Uncharacterized protein n=1 Tax=Caerostris extrusa TaxID=172846 RepID=A0AAV4RBJ7_CAEEX|nr:hypothetical protein CEXT_79531 [Caerostris extrusa]